MDILLLALLVTFVFAMDIKSDGNANLSSVIATDDMTSFKILSRKKRFLIFPDGSSFQIVFCTQNHGYLQLGNIVWFGSTAALAWELPTDPGAFDMFRDQYKVYEGKRRSDILYYLDEDGKIVDQVEYRRKIIINPAFAKRSIDAADVNTNITISKLDRKKMHKSQKDSIPFKNVDATRLDYYRKERQKLYAKLEKFLQTLGWNGKECISKLLCETRKGSEQQASFSGEILRAVFTLPTAPDSKSEHKQYDDAHGANGDCAQLYPNCGDISIV